MRKQFLLEIPISSRKSKPVQNKYVAEVNVVVHREIKYLVIDLYYSMNATATYRIFFDGDKNYLTYDCIYGKWRIGTIDNYIVYEKFDAEDSATKKINQFISDINISKIDDNAYRTITYYQHNVLSDKYQAKMIKQTKHIDDYLDAEVKPLPSDWDNWIDETAMDHSRYVIYEYTGKAEQKAYCTHCKNEFYVTNAKHNETGVCVACGSKITYKSSGKVKCLSDDGKALLLQPTSEGVMFRNFGIQKKYYKDFKNPSISVHEYSRIIYDDKLEIIKRYSWDQYKEWKVRWCETNYIVPDAASLYASNINEVLVDKYDCYKYSAVDILASNTGRYIDLASYQSTINGNNCCHSNMPCTVKQYKECIEKLIKIGLYRMAAEVIGSGTRDIDYKASTPNKILKVQNDDIKILLEADSGLNGLKYFKKVRERGYRYSSRQVEIITNWRADFEQILAAGVHPGRVVKYLHARSEEFVTMYKDYLYGCRELNYNLSNDFIAFPRHLRQSHDEATRILNNQKEENDRNKKETEFKAIKDLESELNNLYMYEDDNYFIRAPHGAGEMVAEGQALHHCVGRMGYIERMANKQTVILFLRKKSDPETPYYTIETFNGTLRQCHGFSNLDTDIKEITPFLNKFKSKVLSKIKKILKVS